MRICIDSIGTSQFNGTGLETFTIEFLRNLLYMYPQPKYDLLYDGVKPEFNIPKSNDASFIDLKINRRENDYGNIESYITSNKIDIYHSPNNGFSIPANKKCHYITTVQSLLPVVNERYVDEKYLKKFNEVFPSVIKNSDKIIVVSEFLREQLKNYFDVPDKNIVVNYPGCSRIFIPKNKEECDDIVGNKYNLKEDYILYVGSIQIRKNLEKLIRAFKYIKLNCKDLKLVLVGSLDGKRKEYYDKLILLVKELNLTEDVIFAGLVDYNDMPYFYSKAKCVVSLSKYEGFPISSIEAAACDTPVVWNNESFFREIFEDTGLMVDANDQDMMVEAISNLIFNNSLQEELVNKQRVLSSKYRWEKHIINTIRVYESFY